MPYCAGTAFSDGSPKSHQSSLVAFEQILEDMDPYQDVEDYDGRNTITEGVLPTLESSLKMASLWPLLQKCWKQKPEQRAKSTACLEHLKNLVSPLATLATALDPC